MRFQRRAHEPPGGRELATVTPGFSARDLRVVFNPGENPVCIVDGVSFDVPPNGITGMAGESGSGKTTSALASIGYSQPGAEVRGESWLDGEAVLHARRARLRRLWANSISYVAQDAASSLNPVRRVRTQFREVLKANGLRHRAADERAVSLLEAVRLREPAAALRKYPHEFSGGQLQRVAIALGLACEPKLLVLDEPTTGLDVTTQAEVIDMLSGLIRETGIAALYISHDLNLLTSIAEKIIIVYAGEIVEIGRARDLATAPRHPYTRALLDSQLSVRQAVRPFGLEGLPPAHAARGSCAFAPRCHWQATECMKDHPPLVTLPDREVRCVRTHMLGVLGPRARRETREREATSRQGPRLVEIRGLRCEYGRSRRVKAVRDVSLAIHLGEVVALVGESGSGKTTIGRSIAGTIRPAAGEILLNSTPLAPLASSRRRTEHRAIQIIFQNPDSSLNPRHTVRTLVEKPLLLFEPGMTRDARHARVDQALTDVKLDPQLAGRYPAELSGGQKQRVAIARAFISRPDLVICDEILSGLDVSVQATLLELIRAMQAKHGTALLFISHDLAAVRSISQYVYVIKDGSIQEENGTEALFDSPTHPYTIELLSSVIEPLDVTEDQARSGGGHIAEVQTTLP
jgi:peptide/nickel transport system ATP-binding protein